MKKAIGLMELKSIPIGIETADEMLKAANVDLIMANPICPGKYMILISGDVGAVKSSIETGKKVADIFLVEYHIINNVHEDVLISLSGYSEIDKVKSIGAIETISAVQVRCMILDAWGWCTGTTQRDDTRRVEGGGFRMGNTCIPVADSC